MFNESWSVFFPYNILFIFLQTCIALAAIRQTIIPSTVVSEEDTSEIAACIAEVAGVDPNLVLVTLEPTRRRRQVFDPSLLRQSNPTLQVTILSSDYATSAAVETYLNSAAFLAALNAALEDAGINIAEAGIATVDLTNSTRKLILYRV